MAVRLLRPPADLVHGTLFAPAAGSGPAVLLIGGSGGSEPSHAAEGLAASGLAALSVAYFARPGLPGQLRDIPLEYFLGGLDILRREFPDAPLAVLGMSRGSEAAVLTAVQAAVVTGAAVRGVVAAVPGNVVAGSWPPGGAAWRLGGTPLPYVEHSGPKSENPDALLPVERVPGPILFVAAGQDRVWPSAGMARAMAARLRDHGDPYGHLLLEYPSAGHSLGYLVPRLPAGLLPPDLTDSPADEAARTACWPEVTRFLARLGHDPRRPLPHPHP